jgi:hypothetical protein
MGKDTSQEGKLVSRGGTQHTDEKTELPSPTMQFRRRAWLHFQRALDPLAPPKPLPTKRQPTKRQH